MPRISFPQSASRTNYASGLWAEMLCRLSLRLRGYSILASRYRSKMGEIDIVAQRGRIVAIIEVKARTRRDDALASVSPRQQERLARGAQDFLAHHPHFAHHDIRFDIMALGHRTWPRHIVDAWRPEI